MLFAAMDARVALINAHTNLDRAPAAGHLLPDALGLEPIKPIERSTMPMALVTVFVPPDHAERVAQAMSGAGAGRIGEYEGCRFVSAEGVGSFTPPARRCTVRGRTRGSPPSAAEVRLEMVAPRDRARGVVAAARGAHPYEEPLITSADVEIARSSARMGMLNRAPEGLTLGALATLAAATFNITPRIWGDPDTTARARRHRYRFGQLARRRRAGERRTARSWRGRYGIMTPWTRSRWGSRSSSSVTTCRSGRS